MVVVRKKAFPPGVLVLVLFGALTAVALYGVLSRVDPAGGLTDSPDGLQAYIELADARLQEAAGGNDRVAVLNEAYLIRAAADKILAGEPGEEQRAFAINAKYNCLSVMMREGDPAAAESLLAFARGLCDDPNPEIAARSARAALSLELAQLSSPQIIAEETAGTLAAAVDEYLSKSGSLDYNLVQHGLNVIAISEKPELAVDGFRRMAAETAEFNAAADVREKFRVRFNNAAEMLSSIGKPIAFEGTPLDGSAFDWSDYRDKTVLVLFFAVGHEEFIKELPLLKRLHDYFHEFGFEIVLISLNDERDAVEQFVAEQSIVWPVLFSDDPAATGLDHPMAVQCGVQLPKSIVLVDRQSNVVGFNAIGRKLVRYLEEEYGPLPEAPPEEPAGDAPATEAPATEAPAGDAPAGEVPSIEEPPNEDEPSQTDAVPPASR